MQTRPFFLALCTTLLALLPNAVFSQPEKEWKLKRNKDGIQVYMREVEGSDIMEMKFSTELEASLNTVAAILINVEGFDDWVYASLESYTIEKVSETEVYYYASLDFPWPLSNRDLVLHTRFWQDKKTLAIHSEARSVHWMKPEITDMVRITKADLSWSFTPIGKGKVLVEYYLNSDPGGSIPPWMINLVADQGPLQTMIKFKEELAKEKYKGVRVAFVKEY